VEVARGNLALALHLPPDSAPAVVDDFPEPPRPLVVSELDVMSRAVQDRPELRGAEEQVKQAQSGTSVAKAEWLPELTAVGTYQHITGQGPFQPRNAWFVGGMLTWDLWTWGATYKNVKVADAQAVQAKMTAQALRSQIVVEARQRLLEAQAAFATIEPARTSLQAATEAHRIQTLRYAEGVASTTDIIDAETDLSRARSAYAQARYRFYMAEVALARAAGALPLRLVTAGAP
jgi:outer membrane protein TolC